MSNTGITELEAEEALGELAKVMGEAFVAELQAAKVDPITILEIMLGVAKRIQAELVDG